ncbi:MAG: hypothetical protein ACI3VS_06340 [Evtepia sp.]
MTVRLRSPRDDLLAVKEAMAYDMEKYGDVAFINVEAMPEGNSQGRRTKEATAQEWAQMAFEI